MRVGAWRAKQRRQCGAAEAAAHACWCLAREAVPSMRRSGHGCNGSYVGSAKQCRQCVAVDMVAMDRMLGARSSAVNASQRDMDVMDYMLGARSSAVNASQWR